MAPTLWKQFEFELTQRAARISIKSQLQLSSVKHPRIVFVGVRARISKVDI